MIVLLNKMPSYLLAYTSLFHLPHIKLKFSLKITYISEQLTAKLNQAFFLFYHLVLLVYLMVALHCDFSLWYQFQRDIITARKVKVHVQSASAYQAWFVPNQHIVNCILHASCTQIHHLFEFQGNFKENVMFCVLMLCDNRKCLLLNPINLHIMGYSFSEYIRLTSINIFFCPR